MATSRESNLHLNGTQRYIISEMMKFPLDEIVQTFIGAPDLLEKALFYMEAPQAVFDANEAMFSKNMLDTIAMVRRVVFHPCPQNTGQTNDVLDVSSRYCIFKLPDVSKRIKTRHKNGDIELKNGRIIKHEDINVDDLQDDYIIAKEPRGLLSLTKREDDVTPPVRKEDVANYIHDVIAEELAVVRSIPNELKTLFQVYSENVKELMQGCDLTLKSLIELGVEDLIKLLDEPEIVALLIKRTHISVRDFINLNTACREFLIKNHKAVIKLAEDGGLSCSEIFQLNESKFVHIGRVAPVIAGLIKKRKIIWQALNEVSAEDLPATILSQLTVSEISAFIISLHREALITRFFLNGQVLIATLRKLELEKRVEVIKRLGTKLCYLVKLEECLEGWQPKHLAELKDSSREIFMALNDILRSGVPEAYIVYDKGVPEAHIVYDKLLVESLRLGNIAAARSFYEWGASPTSDFERKNANRDVKQEINYALDKNDIVVIHDLHVCGLLSPAYVNHCMLEAIKRGAVNFVSLMIQLGANLKNHPYLVEAVCAGNFAVVSLLLDAGAPVDGTGDGAPLACILSCRKTSLVDESIVDLLLKRGAKIDKIPPGLLKSIIDKLSFCVLKLLLDAGLNPNKDSLLDACMKDLPDNDSEAKARLLIRYGAEVQQNRGKYKLKQLQMLLVYNENFARAQSQPFVPPDMGFVKAFWDLLGKNPGFSESGLIDNMITELANKRHPRLIEYGYLIFQLRIVAVPSNYSLHGFDWGGTTAEFYNKSIFRHSVAQALANYILGYISKHPRFSEYIESMLTELEKMQARQAPAVYRAPIRGMANNTSRMRPSFDMASDLHIFHSFPFIISLSSRGAPSSESDAYEEFRSTRIQQDIQNHLSMLGIDSPSTASSHDFLNITCEAVYKNYFEGQLKKSFEQFKEEAKAETIYRRQNP